MPWQRHYRILADLFDADGSLPCSAPGVMFDGGTTSTPGGGISKKPGPKRKVGRWSNAWGASLQRGCWFTAVLRLRPRSRPVPYR